MIQNVNPLLASEANGVEVKDVKMGLLSTHGRKKSYE